MLRHPLSALFLLIAAWTQVFAPTMVTCVAATMALDRIPICHAGAPTSGGEDAPATPVEHTCVFCVACHAVGEVPAPVLVLGAPLVIARAAHWQMPADPLLRREAFTRARARSPPNLA